jgi:alpha-tubulin suppressor-like RCC1 family protein
MRAVALVAVLSIAAACKYKVARYCDEQTPCDDPAFPFCDFDGALEGVERQCVANPVDGGQPDAGEDDSQVVQIAGGGSIPSGTGHTCALLTDGRIKCFGNNETGQLGIASTVRFGDDEPARDAPFALLSRPARSIAAGVFQSCAVFENGEGQCWGFGDHGELGQGEIEDIGDNEAPSSRPAIELGGAVAEICTGDAYTCARLENGDVRCFGLFTGIPGVNQIGASDKPVDHPPIDLAGNTITGLGCGFTHVCALTQAGAIFCWGGSQMGALGYPGITRIPEPASEEHPGDFGAVQVGAAATQVVAGQNHTCVLLEGGSVRCWGSGPALGYGEADLVLGDDEPPSSGARIVDLDGIAEELVAAGSMTCARLAGGDVRCWGFPNGSTDVPLGDDESPTTFPPLPFPEPAVALGAGSEHACAILESGDVYCWGKGANGRLGYGDEDDVGIETGVLSKGPVPLLTD